MIQNFTIKDCELKLNRSRQEIIRNDDKIRELNECKQKL